MRSSLTACLLALALVACTTDADGDGVKADDDCNDEDDTVFPGAVELCDGVDNDCDGDVDNLDPEDDQGSLYYIDADGDGFGAPETGQLLCPPDDGEPELDGYADNPDDCDDTSELYNPDATENDCTDPEDYNCDGSVGYEDADGDGWAACEDCDDSDAALSPGATEVCDDIDNNCNGVVDLDASETPTWYLDYDGDGYGDPTVSVAVCDPPARFVADSQDCDDSSELALPGGTEVCDGLDNDCDGTVDGADADGAQAYYTDGDGDGYGTDGTVVYTCEPASDQVAESGDCDDTDGTVSPGATEVCNDGVDNDCDGTSEGCEIDTETLSDAILRGDNASDYAGRSLAIVGDLNNDGVDDLVVGADGYDNGSGEEGAAYVIYGPLTAGFDDTLGNAAHVTMLGSSADGGLGDAVSGIGDIDGDGLDDFLVAASTASDRAVRSGTAHLWLGSTIAAQTSGASLSIDDSDAKFAGNDAYDWAGSGLLSIGDWDDDGYDDFVIGATGDDIASTGSGTVYLFLGDGSAPSGTVSVQSSSDYYITGNNGWYIGADLAAPGDFDGDGYPDLAIGVIQANANGVLSGGVFVYTGDVTGVDSISNADLTLNGAAAGDRAGSAVHAAGDVDGDGYGDLWVGVSRDDTGGADAGAVMLVSGRSDIASIDGNDLQSEATAILTGPSSSLAVGDAVAGDFDWDGDSNSDVLVGVPRAGLNGEGVAYLVLGPVSGTSDVATESHASFVGDGTDDGIGTFVTAGGDLFGNGHPTLAIGGWEDDSNGSDAGGVYLVDEIGL